MWHSKPAIKQPIFMEIYSPKSSSKLFLYFLDYFTMFVNMRKVILHGPIAMFSFSVQNNSKKNL
jgi:hypothetical protein